MIPIEILLVEDNPGDVRLTREALKQSNISNNLSVIEDGAEAIRFLMREGEYEYAVRPDIILLDLNLPRIDGREVLQTIKQDENLRRIPVVVLTTSDDEHDILASYNLYANCYITKPLDYHRFITIIQSIQNFWFATVKLPSLV